MYVENNLKKEVQKPKIHVVYLERESSKINGIYLPAREIYMSESGSRSDADARANELTKKYQNDSTIKVKIKSTNLSPNVPLVSVDFVDLRKKRERQEREETDERTDRQHYN